MNKEYTNKDYKNKEYTNEENRIRNTSKGI